MGCFDYTCECKGKTCEHVGGQLHESKVIIKVPLSDGTHVYLEGDYEEYGYVTVKLYIASDGGYVSYNFYLKEFEEYFEGWLRDESVDTHQYCLLATNVWTFSERTTGIDNFGDEVEGTVSRRCFDSVGQIPCELTLDIVKKCTRIDDEIDFDTKQKQRIKKLKATVEFMQKELGRKNRP